MDLRSHFEKRFDVYCPWRKLDVAVCNSAQLFSIVNEITVSTSFLWDFFSAIAERFTINIRINGVRISCLMELIVETFANGHCFHGTNSRSFVPTV